jgi:PAS domain S-box-containing protein
MKAKLHNKPSYTAHEISELQARLREAEDTIEAIREGAIDALVVKDHDQAQQIFTLKSADYTYRLLIESMSQGALTISAEGIILYSNKQFSTLVGKPLQQIIGSAIQECINTEDVALILAITTEGSKDVNGSERTLRLRNKNSTEVIVSASKLPQIGNDTYMCLVVTDLTERQKAEFAKNEFISLASHQLRTPATGVKQYIGMLLEGYAGDLSEQQRVYAKTAYDSNERQLAIINSILKTAQIDFGAYELKKTRQNITTLIKETMSEFIPILNMRKQTVTYKLEEDVFCMVEPVEISLVIANLIENASKYSPEGSSFEITLYKKAHSISFSVTDHGVGIRRADQAKIFEKFTRINNPQSDTISGNGLGLYWVKKIVELHDGSIKLVSAIKKGSTFTIELPA